MLWDSKFFAEWCWNRGNSHRLSLRNILLLVIGECFSVDFELISRAASTDEENARLFPSSVIVRWIFLCSRLLSCRKLSYYIIFSCTAQFTKDVEMLCKTMHPPPPYRHHAGFLIYMMIKGWVVSLLPGPWYPNRIEIFIFDTPRGRFPLASVCPVGDQTVTPRRGEILCLVSSQQRRNEWMNAQ